MGGGEEFLVCNLGGEMLLLRELRIFFFGGGGEDLEVNGQGFGGWFSLKSS